MAKLEDTVFKVLSEWADEVITPEDITEDTVPSKLGIDSLDYLAAISDVEDALNIKIEAKEIKNCMTIKGLIKVCNNKLEGK